LANAACTHHKELDKGLAKRVDDVIDLGVQFVGSEERPPSSEDGMRHLEHANVDFGIGVGEAADEFLEVLQSVRGKPWWLWQSSGIPV